MTIHVGCARHFRDLVDTILIRADMDESAFQVIERTGRDWDFVRSSIDYAMVEQNLAVQDVMRELQKCECVLYAEEKRRR